jgi:hypothetical protein
MFYVRDVPKLFKKKSGHVKDLIKQMGQQKIRSQTRLDVPNSSEDRPSTTETALAHGHDANNLDYGNSQLTRENFDPRKHQITFNFLWHYLTLGFYRQKRDVFQRGREVLLHYFDIQYIFDKLIEVEKLKRLLLDKHQLLMFENTPRPEIQVEGNNFALIHHYILEEQKPTLDGIAESYNAVSEQAQESDGISARLLEMLDPQFSRTVSKIHAKKQPAIPKPKLAAVQALTPQKEKLDNMLKQLKEMPIFEVEDIHDLEQASNEPPNAEKST